VFLLFVKLAGKVFPFFIGTNKEYRPITRQHRCKFEGIIIVSGSSSQDEDLFVLRQKARPIAKLNSNRLNMNRDGLVI